MKRKLNINMNLLSLFLLLLALIVMFLSVTEGRNVNARVQEQTEIEEALQEGDRQSQNLLAASDYLTNCVRHFVSTGTAEYMESYWDEVDNVRSRDTALQRLTQLSLSDEELQLVRDAKQESDDLIRREIRAMRLTAESLGMKKEDMPPRVASDILSIVEDGLSLEGKKERAVQIIFSEEYAASKTLIRTNLADFQRLLTERKNVEFADAAAKTKAAIQRAQVYNILLLAILSAAIVLFYLLMIRPLRSYTRCLKQMDADSIAPLKSADTAETQMFVEAFNRLYSDWENQKTRLKEEQFRFRVAIENTSVIVFEYDPATDLYTAYGSLGTGNEKAGRKQMERVLPHFVQMHLDKLVEESALLPIKQFAVCTEGQILDARVRTTSGSASFVWTRINCVPILDANGKVTKLIGKITNIQSEKEKELALEEVRSRDGLTGLYNKEAGLRKVQDFMEHKDSSEICGMMLLDMDNFDQINEAEGTLFADALLQEVADILRALTGPEDIRVRLGGDEFMLFIKGCPKSRATVLGPQIAETIQQLSLQNNPDIKVSASIGMCVTEVVDEYSGLYRCTESTLKYVKSNCKGKAACYLDTSNELGTMLTQVYPEKHFINDIDRPSGPREANLVSFALDLLGRSKNLDDAISLLLARIGRYLHLDRVSLIEIDRDYLTFCFCYQWSNNPADLLLENTYYISQDDLLETETAFSGEECLCEYHYIAQAETMGSCLHAPIWDHGALVGGFCFEVREKDHNWMPSHRKLLMEMTKIIASFTLKEKADAVSQAKTDFLSRMSHEIRTPMNAITGMTLIAKTVLDDPERELDCLNKIESANTYLLSLVNDILDMSRIESGKVELSLSPVDLNKLLQYVEDLFRPQADEKQLRFLLDKDFPSGRRFMADELRLNQILVNLLGNAVKFTNPGGQIQLSAIRAEETARDILIRFSVSDTGIGIAEEAQARIFSAFEQASNKTVSAYGGTGLGLTISSRLVQMMGGTLEVKSRPGEGSEFYFSIRLPFAAETASKPALQAELPLASYDPAGRRILLAEDNELNREIAETLLAANGYIVETASNGEEAVRQYEQSEPFYYDAVLMDIRMPIMDGMEATQRIRTSKRADSRHIPILAMTANAFDDDMKKSLDSGMNGHLSKPINVDKLLDTLRRCILEAELERGIPGTPAS